MLPLSMYMEKSMLYVGGRPVIRRIVDRLRHTFPKMEIYIVVLQKYLDDVFHEFRDVKNRLNFKPVVKAEGTVRAYQEVMSFTNPEETEILLHYADSIVDIDYKEMLFTHNNYGNNGKGIIRGDTKADCTLAVSKNIKHEYSQVNFDKKLKVYAFYEKPTLSEYSWTGVAILNRHAVQKAIDYDGANWTEPDFGTHIFPTMLAMEQEVLAYPFNGTYQDAGNILSYWRLKKDGLQGKEKKPQTT